MNRKIGFWKQVWDRSKRHSLECCYKRQKNWYKILHYFARK